MAKGDNISNYGIILTSERIRIRSRGHGSQEIVERPEPKTLIAEEEHVHPRKEVADICCFQQNREVESQPSISMILGLIESSR
jgi:hypothetical protein